MLVEIVRTDDTLDGDPRIAGTWIGVHTIHEPVVAGGHPPEDVADQLDVGQAEVYAGLAYYYENPEAMREGRGRHEEIEAKLEESTLRPPQVVD